MAHESRRGALIHNLTPYINMASLRFQILYRTEWGERLCLHLTTAKGKSLHLPMSTIDGYLWTGSLELPTGTESLYYKYCVVRDTDVPFREERCCRYLDLQKRTHLLLDDCWEDDSIHPALRRKAFEECIFRPSSLDVLTSSYRLVLKALPAPKGWHWAVVGASKKLGEWNVAAAKRLQRTGVYEWGIALGSTDFTEGTEYKYLLVNDADATQVKWEQGGNRVLMPTALEQNEAAVHTDIRPRIDMAPWRGAGVVVPVFSLRSKGSFGVGDFGDLAYFVEWAFIAGLRAVQLLPINDTTTTGTWRDSYPYSGISVFALHPLYLDLREWEHLPIYQSRKEKGEYLNSLPELDYESVYKEKMAFLRELFVQIGKKTLRSVAFKSFCKENNRWLSAYARFCRLRDEYGTANFREWKENADDMLCLTVEQQDTENFHCFVQFLLHRQLEAVHRKAQSSGVVLKGDIPIGICRDSVPAWADTRLFHFDGQAGAPPDAFAKHGQNWGFPTYNWEEMRKDGYAWWKERFRHMGRYFDAYRIDHVLGFFRIWEIPYQHVYGLLGYFRPALPLTKEEIKNWGFGGNVEELARPILTAQRLAELEATLDGQKLGAYFEEIVMANGQQGYALKEAYTSQRSLYAAIADERLRQVVMDVVAEVLFIEDTDRPHTYHPRIASQETWRFSTLTAEEQHAYNRLYDDFFYVRHNEFWAAEAMKKLPEIIGSSDLYKAEATESSLLPCAEDLGMVPSSVKGVLEALDVLSLEIQRMPKRYGLRFDNLSQNPWLSVSTIATHDMPPFRLWWHEQREQTQAFWSEVLAGCGEAPVEATPEICEKVVSMHLESPSMFCLLALQDLLAIDPTLRHPNPWAEQINVPSNPEQYWRYRMHISIENLIAATNFNEKLRALILRSGRRD